MCDCDLDGHRFCCHCDSCHETFTTVTGFDLHRSSVSDGTFVCDNPASLRRENGDPVYFRLGDLWAQFSRSVMRRIETS